MKSTSEEQRKGNAIRQRKTAMHPALPFRRLLTSGEPVSQVESMDICRGIAKVSDAITRQERKDEANASLGSRSPHYISSSPTLVMLLIADRNADHGSLSIFASIASIT